MYFESNHILKWVLHTFKKIRLFTFRCLIILNVLWSNIVSVTHKSSTRNFYWILWKRLRLFSKYTTLILFLRCIMSYETKFGQRRMSETSRSASKARTRFINFFCTEIDDVIILIIKCFSNSLKVWLCFNIITLIQSQRYI